jgi:uncharacterized protein HemX
MKIDSEALNLALAQAVMNAFTPEMQTEVFREALRGYLFEPVTDNYGKKPSPLTQAFQKALDNAAYSVAKEFVSQPEQTVRIQAALKEAFDAVIVSPDFKQKVVDKVARAMAGW